MNLISSVFHYAEPMLEFGGGGRHIDVRFGLRDFGPVDHDPDNPRTIAIGMVGTTQTVSGLREWMGCCENGIPAKKSRQPNLFPPFGGTALSGPFRCSFVTGDADTRTISASRIAKICAIADDSTAIEEAVAAAYGRGHNPGDLSHTSDELSFTL